MSLELKHSGKYCGECLLTSRYISIMPMRGREKGDIEGRYTYSVKVLWQTKNFLDPKIRII